MKVALGSKGDYSVRAILEAARYWERGRRKAREIAAAMEIPEPYVGQILANLVQHEILTAVAGPDGGYSLARPPEQITLLEVVEAAEGLVTLESCVLRGGRCEWEAVCPVHESWFGAQEALKRELSKTTFAELARVDAALDEGSYEPPADVPQHEESAKRRAGRRDRIS